MASRKITVVASGVSTAVTSRKVEMPRGWFFFSTSITVNCTSAEVSGLPSWNCTSERSLKVIVLPSGATVQLSARLALGFRSKPYSSRPSNTFAVT